MTLNLDKLEALRAEATQGEWVGPWGDTHTIAAFDGQHDWTPETDSRGDPFPLAQYVLPADAAYIAALHNAAHDLIRRARRADALEKAYPWLTERADELTKERSK